MSARLSKTETSPTPESRLIEAEATLAALEVEHRAAADRLAGLTQADSLRDAKPEALANMAAGIFERARPYFGLTPHMHLHEIEAATAAEPEIRARLVEARGQVARLRQQVRGRQAAAMRDEYNQVSARMARALSELNDCIVAERDIADRVNRIGVLSSPLPDLSFSLIGTKDHHNSPMAGWFRRARKAGILE